MCYKSESDHSSGCYVSSIVCWWSQTGQRKISRTIYDMHFEDEHLQPIHTYKDMIYPYLRDQIIDTLRILMDGI